MTKAVKKTDKNDKKDTVKAQKGFVVDLLRIISGLKIGGMSQESMFNLIDFKLEINKIAEEMERKNTNFREELRKAINPDMNASLTSEQEEDFKNKSREYWIKLLEEKIDIVPLKTRREDLFSIIKDNNLTILQVEMLKLVIHE